MKKRVVSFVLTVLMLVACLPVSMVAAETKNTDKVTIYILDDVYGKPGETVEVKVGFKNTTQKNIQQFSAVLDAGDAVVNETTYIEMTPACGGNGFSNTNGTFGFAAGAGSFSVDTYANVLVTIPEDAKDGDVYDLTLSASKDFPDILRWVDSSAAGSNVTFEGAKLYVSRYDSVTVSVKDTVVSVGDTEIRVPILMSATDGKLASCSQLSFSISGNAAHKVEIDTLASKEFKIMGVNDSYLTILPEARSFTLGFASGFENAVAPTDNFQIFELVLRVVSDLTAEDEIKVNVIGANPFKAYGEDATETVPLYVKEYVSGTVSTVLPYEWVVLDEEAATAALTLYTGSATVVKVPSTIIGNGTVGTAGKKYTVVELYGDSEESTGVFYGNEDITSITIPESVKVIDEYAITECPELVEVIVMSPDLEIVENDGDTFLYYYGGKKIGYILPENLVIYSYESATVKTWADENEAEFSNLIKFVGVQKGDEGVRFIGGVSGLEYQSIDFNIYVVEAEKTFSSVSTRVYKTLKGKFGDESKPVVTTVEEVANETGAYLVSEFSYLYGYAISGVPSTGSFTFRVTPAAVTAGGVTVYGETMVVTYVDGAIVNN